MSVRAGSSDLVPISMNRTGTARNETFFTSSKNVTVIGSIGTILSMVLSTVAQVPVLARAKFNHGQLQCEFVQTVLVINDVYTHIFSQSYLQEHCLHGSPRRCTCTRNLNFNQKISADFRR